MRPGTYTGTTIELTMMMVYRNGSDDQISMSRCPSRSSLPLTYPSRAPMLTPVPSAMSRTSSANVSETLNPYERRTSTSRPRSSVPSGCARDGGCGGYPGWSRSDSFGLYGIRRHEHPVPGARRGKLGAKRAVIRFTKRRLPERGGGIEPQHRDVILALVSDEKRDVVEDERQEEREEVRERQSEETTNSLA